MHIRHSVVLHHVYERMTVVTSPGSKAGCMREMQAGLVCDATSSLTDESAADKALPCNTIERFFALCRTALDLLALCLCAYAGHD